MTMGSSEACADNVSSFFQTRGVVLVPSDLTLKDWPERAKKAGLTTIALHPTPAKVEEFVTSETGQAFLRKCCDLGLETEYELHAMGDLLPRKLFEKHPTLFRMNNKGDRSPQYNLCVSSERAVEIVSESAVRVAEVLRPTTGRYFYWGDDNKPWCRCPKCRALSDSDQALLLENRMLDALRKVDATAQIAHLAYANTLDPPTQVAPQPGIFLEFAPIKRRYDAPVAAENVPENRRYLELLDANLGLFRRDTAQALEYWLDSSRFSKWRRPAVKIPWSREVFISDLDTYGARGIRHITTFAVFVDARYVEQYGEPPLGEYGALLETWPSHQGHAEYS